MLFSCEYDCDFSFALRNNPTHQKQILEKAKSRKSFSMDELRTRFDETIAASEHDVRRTEHAIFARLLYRSKNQHRHGLYFRRLQHIQRLLGRMKKHDVWKSLRSALGPNAKSATQTATKKKKSMPLLLSTVTRDDINNAVQLLDALVSSVLPDAATAITTQLVVRHHFLPFAVSIIASLSRIFVIERKLLNDLRAISIDLNVFLSETADGRSLLNDPTLPGEEDVGLEILPEDNNVQKEKPTEGAPEHKKQHFTAEDAKIKVSVKQGADPENPTKSSDVFNTNDEEPSLYSIVASKSGPMPSLSKTQNAISVTLLPLPLPESAPKTSRGDLKRKYSDNVYPYLPQPLKKLKTCMPPMENNDTTSAGQSVTATESEKKYGQASQSTSPQLVNPSAEDIKKNVGTSLDSDSDTDTDSDSKSEDPGDAFKNDGQPRSSSVSFPDGIETNVLDSEKLGSEPVPVKSTESPLERDEMEDSGSEDLDDIFGALKD